MKAVLDAGAFVAIEKRDRRVGAMLRVFQQRRIPVSTSAAVVAQVWRDGRRQALLSLVLAGVDVKALAAGDDRRTGELLARSRTADVVDAHLSLQVDADDRLLTSDRTDLERLLAARRVHAVVVAT